MNVQTLTIPSTIEILYRGVFGPGYKSKIYLLSDIPPVVKQPSQRLNGQLSVVNFFAQFNSNQYSQILFSFSSMEMQAYIKIQLYNDAQSPTPSAYDYPILSEKELFDLQN